MFSIKTKKDRKKEGHHYHEEKLQKRLCSVKLVMVCQAENKSLARAKLKSISNNFEVFKNYPLNDFKIRKIQCEKKSG